MAFSLPPITVTQKTVKENCFSKHDNRHAFQNSGVYFGQGLGKRPITRDKSQHISHPSWTTPPLRPTATPTESTYVSDFCQGKHAALTSTPGSDLPKPAQSVPLMHKFHVFSKPSFRRFPHTHRPGAGLDPPPPLFKLASWFPHEHRAGSGATTTPLVVLAESQKPLLPHNQWTYSYKL